MTQRVHFEDAARDEREDGRSTWLAHTQHDYARMLLERGEPLDSERARSTPRVVAAPLSRVLGLTALTTEVSALQN